MDVLQDEIKIAFYKINVSDIPRIKNHVIQVIQKHQVKGICFHFNGEMDPGLKIEHKNYIMKVFNDIIKTGFCCNAPEQSDPQIFWNLKDEAYVSAFMPGMHVAVSYTHLTLPTILRV